MERILIVLLVVAIVVTVLRYSREYMTNKDLLDTLKTFGQHGTPSKKEKTTGQTDELPIYGPKGVPSPPPPKPAPVPKPGNGTTSTYPDIYGPEIVLTPGVKPENGKHESDAVHDKTYDYNPDLKNAFPTDGTEPMPYLNDLSKIQR